MEKIGDPPTWSQFFPRRRRAEQEFEAAFDDVIEGAGADIGCGSEHCVEKQLAQGRARLTGLRNQAADIPPMDEKDGRTNDQKAARTGDGALH